jgi:hypothetical protein
MGDLGQSHIEITVGGTTYPLVIDTWQEVDAIDFAPRAVAGSPAFSEMGLYLDVPQQRWDHGFGKWRFTEEASYAFTGNGVDTSHGFVSLFTLPVQIFSKAGMNFWKMASHRGVNIFAGNDGLYMQKTDLSLYHAITGENVRDIASNGDYFFMARGGRMRVGDCGDVASATGTTLVCTGRLWTVDLFNGGTVFIYEGTAAGESQAVTDTSSNTITVASWGTQPDATSKFLVYNGAGVGGNPPNDFYRLAVFGGFMWASEFYKPYVHFWAELDGTDAEGGQDTDTAAIRVGPGNVTINTLAAFQNQLWVMREDGAWVIGDDNVAYHTLNLQDQAHEDNFQVATVWNGFFIFPIRNTLYKYRSGLQDITPPRFNDELPYKIFGWWRGVVPRGKFLYALGHCNQPYTPEDLESWKFGSIMRTDGVGWHKILDMPLDIKTPRWLGMWLDSVNDRIYFHAEDWQTDISYVWYFDLDEYSDLPYASYPTSGDHNLYSSYYDFGLRRIDKSWANVTLDGDFPSGASVTVSYRGDDQSAWTSLGTISAAMGVVAFPAATEHKKVQIKMNLQTSNSANTPVVKALILKAMMRPKVLYSISCDVMVQDELSGPSQTMMGLTAGEIRTALKAARDSVSPITLRDLHGDSAQAYLSSVRFQLVEYEGTEAVAEVARCTFVYVNTAS